MKFKKLGLGVASACFIISGIQSVNASEIVPNKAGTGARAGICLTVGDMLNSASVEGSNTSSVGTAPSTLVDGVTSGNTNFVINDTDLEGSGIQEVEVETQEEREAREKQEAYNYANANGVIVPSYFYSSGKNYMPYSAVTSTKSRQWKVLRGENSWTDHATGFRMNGDRICIALGTAWGISGDKVDLVMANGNVVKCIIGDSKANCDTEETNRAQAADLTVVEIIVDYSSFNRPNGGRWYPEYLDGQVLKICNLGQ